ncbi:MAG: metallophosphoesterase, partial [Vicinamibacteria bacterium]
MQHPRSLRLLPWLFLALAVLLVTEARAEQTSKWEWDEVPRIVAMGDVHGHLDKLTAILKGTGIIDSELKWSGASDHVVLCGDLVDRGPDDRETLDFLQRLQKEAERQGGRVHALVGNHDLMNLVRDYRFVAPESYQDFAEDERSKDREAAWEVFRQFTEDIPEEQKKATFDEQFPPGYFAHQRAFGSEGKYGSWLAKQPIIIKINGVVFLHGGLT